MTEKEIEMHNELSREAEMRHLLQEHLGQADAPDTPRVLRRDVRRAMRAIRHTCARRHPDMAVFPNGSATIIIC